DAVEKRVRPFWSALFTGLGPSRSHAKRAAIVVARTSLMPRACPVESHARGYTTGESENFTRCHGLAPWSFTLAATRQGVREFHKMPRACPVEFHARCYTTRSQRISQDATGW